MTPIFFKRTFNITFYLLFLGSCGYILSFVITLLEKILETINFPPLNDLIILFENKLHLIAYASNWLSGALIFIALFLILIEWIQRLKNDSIWNYFKSIYQTINFRRFLRQDETSKSVISFDNQTTVTKVNPILKAFNQIVSKCIVDVRNDSVTVFIKFPRSQQAQKLLKDMEEHIKEEISSRNPDYYFSSPSRKGNTLWFKGTRR